MQKKYEELIKRLDAMYLAAIELSKRYDKILSYILDEK